MRFGSVFLTGVLFQAIALRHSTSAKQPLPNRKVGNVYVQFREEEYAAKALKNLSGRYYAGILDDHQVNIGSKDGSYDEYVSDERYRSMLGQHVHKYKRRHKYNKLSASASTRNGMFGSKGGIGSKDHKFGNGRQGVQNIETVPQYVGHYKEADFSSDYGLDRFILGMVSVTRLQRAYEMLAASLNLPKPSDMRVEEFYFTSTLYLGPLASMMSADKRFGPIRGSGMGEPKPQYESLWARLSSQTSNNSAQKFGLKVSDAALDSYSAPEGATGGFRRFIMSESGVLQVHYVKVLEKGDTSNCSALLWNKLQTENITSVAA
ncbi:putative DNA helicase [Helianthus annuus]|nr:putative DNA helicase [Helianthus annuus]